MQEQKQHDTREMQKKITHEDQKKQMFSNFFFHIQAEKQIDVSYKNYFGIGYNVEFLNNVYFKNFKNPKFKILDCYNI